MSILNKQAVDLWQPILATFGGVGDKKFDFIILDTDGLWYVTAETNRPQVPEPLIYLKGGKLQGCSIQSLRQPSCGGPAVFNT